jgi:aryl-alcohol dehydrogenase-like predicted oxidoreductase
MHYTNLGKTGVKVSRLCLGTMTFGGQTNAADSFTIMDKAVAAGVNFFDTADIYSYWIEGNRGGESEEVVGDWLKGKNRRDYVIATKARGPMWDGPNGEGLSRTHLLHAVEDSLRRLKTDYIDLYQVHWPDHDTPLEETLRTLDSLVQSGKVRYIGVSNYPAWLLTKSLWISDVRNLASFEVVQPSYSLLKRKEFERELADLCRDQGLGVIPYSPLAAGFLTGKYTREDQTAESHRNSDFLRNLLNTEAAFKVLDVVSEIAENHHVPVPQIALAWLLAQPVITAPIVGARTPEQIEPALGATAVQLSAEEIERLNTVSADF